MSETVLDLRGLKCPLPALKTRRALALAAPGSRLTVECTDPLTVIDIPHVCQETGDRLESQSQDGAVLRFVIRKAGGEAPIVGVVLAGGLSRRMGGGDKALRLLNGRPVLAHVIDRLAGQVDRLVINAHGDPARWAPFGLTVLADPVEGHPGPLAGVLAALDHVAAREGPDALVLSVPVDGPFLPLDLANRLRAARAEAGAAIACAASGGRMHAVHALWPVALRGALRQALIDDGVRKVAAFVEAHPHVAVEWAGDAARPGEDAFFNLNTPEDWAAAEAMFAADLTR
jgi:molybdopterin-guanine dinucleotide biosynthesis protein A